MFNNTVDICSEALSECTDVPDNKAIWRSTQRSEEVDRFDANELSKKTNLSCLNGRTVTVKICGSNTGMEYARLEYVVFDSEPIALIEYLEVDKNIRSNGIATQFRSDLIKSLSEVDSIYSKVSNEKLESVVRRHDFRPLSERPSDNWYVMEK